MRPWHCQAASRLTLLNLLTPVKKKNFKCSSGPLSTECRFLSPSHLLMAAPLSAAQNGFVVFVNQHRRTLASFLVGLSNQVGKAARQVGLARASRQLQVQCSAIHAQNLSNTLVQHSAVTHHAAAEADANHRVFW